MVSDFLQNKYLGSNRSLSKGLNLGKRSPPPQFFDEEVHPLNLGRVSALRSAGETHSNMLPQGPAGFCIEMQFGDVEVTADPLRHTGSSRRLGNL